jgi:hypothetical protein
MKLFDFNNVKDTDKLLRYRRVMLWVVGACVFTSISMVSGLALGMAFGFHAAELIILGISCVISLTTVIPFLFFFSWINEIEKILMQRQVKFDCSINRKMKSWALKMMFWAILVVLLPMLVRKLTG